MVYGARACVMCVHARASGFGSSNKNTLVVNANIRAVGAEEDYEPEVFPSGVLPAGLEGISNLHGWHVLHGEVLAFVDLEAREYHGGEDIAEEEFYKARVTFLVEGPDCQVLENDSNYMRQSSHVGVWMSTPQISSCPATRLQFSFLEMHPLTPLFFHMPLSRTYFE